MTCKSLFLFIIITLFFFVLLRPLWISFLLAVSRCCFLLFFKLLFFFSFFNSCKGKFGSGPKGGTDGYGTHKCQLFTDMGPPKDLTSMISGEVFRFNWFLERYNITLAARKAGIEYAEGVGSDFCDMLDEEKALLGREVRLAYPVLNRARQILACAYISAFTRVDKLKPGEEPKKMMKDDIFSHRMNELSLHIDMVAELIEVPEKVSA